jgi:hypothetical protein
MLKRKIAIWIAQLFFASMSLAQPPTRSNSDDCGSGFTAPLVPDFFFGCVFQDACKAHDVCYGACDKGGIKHGTAYCDLSEYSPERKAAKRACDSKFYADIVSMNEDKSYCKKLAAIYAGVVKVVGQGPFNGKVTNASMDKIIRSSQTADEAAEKATLLFSLAEHKGVDLERVQLQGTKLLVPLPKRPGSDFSKTMIAVESGIEASRIRLLQKELGIHQKK